MLQAELRMTLQRRPLFVSVTIVLPTVLLALLSPLVFAVPVQSGEKMSTNVTMFLTIVFSLSILIDVLPHSSLHASVHVTYLAFLSLQSALAVALSLWVIHLDQRGRPGPAGMRQHSVGHRWTRFVCCTRRYKQGHMVRPNLSPDDRSSRVEARLHSPSASASSTSKHIHLPLVAQEPQDQREHKPRSGLPAFSPFRGSAASQGVPTLELQSFDQPHDVGQEPIDGRSGSGVPRSGRKVACAGPLNGGEEMTWPEVAECVDFVLFRLFLGLTIVTTAAMTTILVVHYLTVKTNHYWGK